MCSCQKILICIKNTGLRKCTKEFLVKLSEQLKKSAPSRRSEIEKMEGSLFQILVLERREKEEPFPLESIALVGDPDGVLTWFARHEDDFISAENSWLPLILMLPPQGEWEKDMEKVVGHPQVLLEGIFRSSHLLDYEDWEERARFEAAMLRILRRSLKRGRGEESFTKPIAWKARITSKSSKDAAFFSLFTDPATRNLLGDMKFAVRDIRTRLRKGSEKNLPDGNLPFFELRKEEPILEEDQEGHDEERNDKKTVDLQQRYPWDGKRGFRIPSILLLGESGTGKTLVARWIAKALYEKILEKDEPLPFCRVNMGAIGKELVDSELFGHMKGSFTDSITDSPGIFLSHRGHVVFLDEIGDMLPKHQTRLLTYMDDGKVRPSGYHGALPTAPTVIVAATNRPVERLASEENGSFRHDLFCRFDHILRLPPLRERKEDIRLLISLVLQDEEINPPGENPEILGIQEISLKAVRYLEKQPYPGNFRELRTCLARGVRKARQEGDQVLCLHHFVET